MRILRERLKNPRHRRGCLACYNMGTSGAAYAYVEVSYLPVCIQALENPSSVQPIVKEIGLCFKHCRARKDTNPNGFLDPDVGLWMNPFNRQIKVGGGGLPIKEELYQLVGGKENVKLLTGVCGKIPLWW